MLYQLHHSLNKSAQPLHLWAQACTKQLKLSWMQPFQSQPITRKMLAHLELIVRCTDNYEKPAFGLKNTQINGEEVRVREEVTYALPFCDLLHFRRIGQHNHPKVLLVAPMSGHYSTLLRGTVEHFLPDHEVYITDWQNARDVPASEGGFTFDDYVRYLIEFMDHLGPNTHLMAVCQPSVAAIVAATVMAERNNPNAPRSLILMGGPIDTRISPTEVNDYASGKDLEWFEKNVINTVPADFAGAGQKVYPGFIQLSGFLSMNMNSHIKKHFKFFDDLVKGDGDSAEAHRDFYNEYLAVMDMPADFYLETIRKVFLEHRLPKGEMRFEGQVIDTSVVTETALLTIEGENDDITGKGQTQAAHAILCNIPDANKEHYEQPDVGHYGIFNGRRFREEIGPKIKAFIQAQADVAPKTLTSATTAK
ncbi:MAG: poly(3-hydroxybutyrate) depolymerase [Motiliproteus sp.]|jgi:poly(3-hydroxybutyrate) depolymerase